MILFEVYVPSPIFHHRVHRYEPHDCLDKMQPLQERIVLSCKLQHIMYMTYYQFLMIYDNKLLSIQTKKGNITMNQKVIES